MELTQKINELKKQQGAVILAHNYQLDEVQGIADYVGDSFYLSKIAASVDCNTIVFCGVRFMAETAKILSPQKTVLLPENDAGCPLADTITAEDVRELKKQHPGALVVCYINSSAEVKAECDLCCTSSNAVNLVKGLSDKKIIFIPDGNLGDYVAKQVPEKEFVLWKGCCTTHAKVRKEHVQEVRARYPEAKVLVHPECAPEVVAEADFAGSTAEIIRYAGTSDDKTFIIGTELGVLHTLTDRCLDKKFYLLHPGLVCPNMKKTRLESIYNALQLKETEIHVPEALLVKAKLALIRMLGR